MDKMCSPDKISSMDRKKVTRITLVGQNCNVQKKDVSLACALYGGYLLF